MQKLGSLMLLSGFIYYENRLDVGLKGFGCFGGANHYADYVKEQPMYIFT